MRRGLATAIAVALLWIGGPAAAFQTGVDPQTMERKRAGKVAWDKAQERARARAAAQAAAAAAAAEEAAEAEAPDPAPVPSYSGGVLSAEQVASFARGAGFPEYHVDDMVRIAWRESTFDPSATNPSSGACGLWQLYPCPGAHAYDPATNAALAFAKYSDGGLSHWGY